MAEPIRLVLADDHPLVRSGIRASLEEADDLQIVGEAEDGHGAQRLCEELSPDVLLLDLSMPGPPALETIRTLSERCPGVKVLILSAYSRDDFVRSLTAVGVAGYVLKDEAMEAVVEAVRTVHRGGTWFSREVVDKAVRQRERNEIFDLTEREQEVLNALGRGLSNAQIAERFGLGEQTVRNYVSRVYDKLGVRNRAEAVIWAQDHGFAGERP